MLFFFQIWTVESRAKVRWPVGMCSTVISLIIKYPWECWILGLGKVDVKVRINIQAATVYMRFQDC